MCIRDSLYLERNAVSRRELAVVRANAAAAAAAYWRDELAVARDAADQSERHADRHAAPVA